MYVYIYTHLASVEGREGQRGSAVQFTCRWPAQQKFGHPWGNHGGWAGTGELLLGCIEARGSVGMGFVTGNQGNHGKLMKQKLTGGKEMCMRALRRNGERLWITWVKKVCKEGRKVCKKEGKAHGCAKNTENYRCMRTI